MGLFFHVVREHYFTLLVHIRAIVIVIIMLLGEREADTLRHRPNAIMNVIIIIILIYVCTSPYIRTCEWKLYIVRVTKDKRARTITVLNSAFKSSIDTLELLIECLAVAVLIDRRHDAVTSPPKICSHIPYFLSSHIS